MEDFLQGLNPVQRKAVEHIDGPSLIIAGAGSGKTRVLTYRIAWLLKNGASPSSILALTFTNKAAREMKERIAGLVDPQLAARLWMGTFHSLFSKILRFEAAAIGFTPDYTIYDTVDSHSIVRHLVKEMSLDDKTYKEREVFSRISMAKNHLMTASAYAANVQLVTEDNHARRPQVSEIYRRYSSKCRNANAMDFDDLLLYTNILFKNNPAILAKYQSKFRYILVDEYQDTNVAQYLIVKRLAEVHKNICVVGDDAQSIYSFRGARIENILNFRRDYPGFAEFKLEQNYRSTQNIVNAANSLIEKNENRLKKTCFSVGDVGERIKVIKAFTDKEEGLLVASSINEILYNHRADYSDFAILYRTNAQSRIFEDSLRKNNIPYRIYGGISFYQRAEIKDALAYMRLAANPADDEAFRRVVNYPARGIGDTTMERLQNAASANNTSFWTTLLTVPLASLEIKENIARKLVEFANLIQSFTKRVHTDDAYSFAMDIIKQSGMMNDLKSNKTPEGVSRLENIEELLNGIKEYAAGKQDGDEASGVMPITEYLQNVALITDADKDNPEDRQKVSLMTVHAAKGLEFDYVYIAGMEEGLFPGTQSAQSENGLEEERRLFYVAITRAAKLATVSHAQTRYKWGNLSTSIPSRFLRDIDKRFLDDKEMDASQQTVSRKRFDAAPSVKPELKRLNIDSNKEQTVQKAIDPSMYGDIKPGVEVSHVRFGVGKITGLSEIDGNICASIDFYDAGKKTLLLKFAKLTVI